MTQETNGVRPLRGTVAEILHHKGHKIFAVGPRETVYDAIAMMDKRHVGALLVMDGEALVGMISERDYTRKIALQGRSSKETLVEEIMTAKVITIAPDLSLKECLQIVTEKAIRHLPVVENGKVLGVISIGDLVFTVLEQQAETIESLTSFIGGSYPK